MQKKLTFFDYFLISRPRFWIYTFGPFLLGIASGSIYGKISTPIWVIIILGLYFLTVANLYIYGINDIYDYETDRLNPKKSGYEMLVTPSARKPLWKTIIISQIPLLIIAPFLPMASWISLLTFLFFAWQYSAPKIRAKARPILDSFFSAGHYVATALVGYFLFSGNKFPWLGIIAGIFWAMAMHAYSAVPDIMADKESFTDTIATKLGAKKTLWLCMVFYFISATIFTEFVGYSGFLLGAPYLFLIYISIKKAKNISYYYKFFPAINTLIGMTVFFLIAGKSLLSFFN